jgi:hypothetical protein
MLVVSLPGESLQQTLQGMSLYAWTSEYFIYLEGEPAGPNSTLRLKAIPLNGGETQDVVGSEDFTAPFLYTTVGGVFVPAGDSYIDATCQERQQARSSMAPAMSGEWHRSAVTAMVTFK